MSFAAAMVMAEGRRRRDDQGRFMQGDQTANYSENRRIGMPIHYSEGNQRETMRQEGQRNANAYNEGGEMGGEGYFAWDGNYPTPYLTPERYGRPGMRDDGNITDMRDYERRRSMGAMNHMGKDWSRKAEHHGRIGFGENDDDDDDEKGEKLTREKAEKWVRNMRTTDDKPLQPISMAEAQRIAPNYGITGEHKMLEFWVVINMMKSDYQTTGQKYASGAVDFYAGLAKDWLEDRDAVEDKMAMYKKYIVKKD